MIWINHLPLRVLNPKLKKSNKLEENLLKKINVNEGFLGKLFGLMMKRPIRRALEKGLDASKFDPELKAKLADLKKSREIAIEAMRTLCDRNPNSALCQNKRLRKRYGMDK